MNDIDQQLFEDALGHLGMLLEQGKHPPVTLVVCGGSALLARNLVSRTTTKDVDVVALAGTSGELLDPEPLPEYLREAAETTRYDLGLPGNWLNNEPSRGNGGLYRAGLPEGIIARSEKRCYGKILTAYLIGRLDQIYFKLPAAADQGGGRHLADLLELNPKAEELLGAARWARMYDPSPGFAWLLRELLKKMGYEPIADQI